MLYKSSWTLALEFTSKLERTAEVEPEEGGHVTEGLTCTRVSANLHIFPSSL